MQCEDIINSLNKSLTSETDDENFDDFVARIRTYIDGQKWIKKPLLLSPPICSQYGWKCIKPDLLECVTCGAKLSASESKIGNYESYKTCIEKMLSNLRDNHGKHCPWPFTPSPESFVKMILMPKEEALSLFLKRMKSSLIRPSFLPKVKESAIEDLGLNEQHILSLCKLANMTNEDALQLGKSIVPLSATGWTITKEEEFDKPVLKCDNCLRSVWCGSFILNSDSHQSESDKLCSTVDISAPEEELKNGLSKEKSDEEEKSDKSGEKEDSDKSNGKENSDKSDEKENSDEPPSKKRKKSLVSNVKQPFNPLYEHRPWCLWIHAGVEGYGSVLNEPSADTITRNLPGWKIFVKSLMRNISDSQSVEISESPSKEQIRNVRNLLEKWTDDV